MTGPQPTPEGDHRGFLREWLNDPMAVASVAPSSPALARLMVAEIGPATGHVVELGPGTGVFTRALLARGVPEEKLILIERAPAFAAMLRVRFPKARVVLGGAEALRRHIADGPEPGAVVSGLPFLAFPASLQLRILCAAFSCLAPRDPKTGRGIFVQFTYGHFPPARTAVAERAGLTATCIGRTVRNLPPASVYRYERTATT